MPDEVMETEVGEFMPVEALGKEVGECLEARKCMAAMLSNIAPIPCLHSLGLGQWLLVTALVSAGELGPNLAGSWTLPWA